MLKAFTAAVFLTVFSTIAQANGVAETPDFFMISRGGDGMFVGSHKIFLREADGLTKVKYCGRSYWVRPVTVAWTQLELENSHEVRVEFNRGKGWRPICERPTDYVTLQDLGVKTDPYFVFHFQEDEVVRVNKFKAVSDSIRRGDAEKRGYATFHGKKPNQ